MKRLLFLITLTVTLLSFVSCKIGDSNDGTDGEGSSDNGSTNAGDANGGSSEGGNGESKPETVYLYAADSVKTGKTQLLSRLNSGLTVNVMLGTSSSSGRRILIGDDGSEVAKKANRVLERMLAFEYDRSGYAIYAYNGIIAIAYDSEYALDDAIFKLIETFSGEATLESREGTLARESFEYTARLDTEREEMKHGEFSTLSEVLGNEIADTLESLYMLYGRELYTWIANLYDPINGGFYYSNSGRDTEGYLPDLESTRQALTCLENAGMFDAYSGHFEKALPKEVKESLEAFVKGLQSPLDGYFYHPQWGNSISTTRRGRDLDWAELLLNSLGASPLYDTPRGMKGSLGAPGSHQTAGGEIEAVAYKARLGASVSQAVAIAVSSSSSLPDYLKSLEKFEDYLDTLDFKNKSYASGNALAATATQIVAAGSKYVDFLEKYLNDRQNSNNGLWETDVTFESVNGLMKISQTYTIINRPIPNIEKAMKSAIKIALTRDLTLFSAEDEHICSVYNPWVAMTHLVNSAESTGGAERVNVVRALVLEHAEDLVQITKEKINIFKKSDGGFSYTRLASAENSSGVQVAVPKSYESDMNATSIASSGTMNSMLFVLGVPTIDMFTDADCEYFLDMLDGMGEIVKSPVPERERTDFDDYPFGGEAPVNGVVTSPDEGITTTVADTELSDDGVYKWFSSTIVKNHADDSEPEDMVLKSSVYRENSSEKKYASGHSYTTVLMKMIDKDSNCYVFDLDMLLDGSDGLVGQIFFTDANAKHTLGLTMTVTTVGKTKYLKFGEVYAGLDTVKDELIGAEVPIEGFFNLRVELYKDFYDGKTLTVNSKIYVNGKLVGESDGGYASTVSNLYINRLVDRVSVYYQRDTAGDVYLNNVLCERIKKEFIGEDSTRPAPPPPPEPDILPDKPSFPALPIAPTVEDFEAHSKGESLGYVIGNGSTVGYEATVMTKNDNNYLHINNRAVTGSKYIKHAVKTNGVFDEGFSHFEFYAELTLSELQGTYTIQNLRPDGNGTTYATLIDIMADGSIKLSSVNTDTKENYAFTTAKGIIKEGVRHTLRLVGECTIGGMMALYVDGEYVAAIKVATKVAGCGFIFQTNAVTEATFDNAYFVGYAEKTVSDSPTAEPDTPPSDSEEPGEYAPSASVLPVKDGATGILVLIHDDGHLGSAAIIDSLYERYSLKGDVALILNRVYDTATETTTADYSGWLSYTNNGRWKVVSHSTTHSYFGTEEDKDGDGESELYPDSQKIYDELVMSRNILKQLFATQRVLTFAYPGYTSELDGSYSSNEVYGDEFKEVLASTYIAGRLGNGTAINAISSSTDFLCMNALVLDNDKAYNDGKVTAALETISTTGGIAILYMHRVFDMTDEQIAAGNYANISMSSKCLDNVLNDASEYVKDGSVWNAHYEDAVLYVREAKAALINVGGDESGITVKLSLDGSLETDIYNFPLTVRVRVPESWICAKAIQGESSQVVKVEAIGNAYYADFNLLPNGSEVTVVEASEEELPVEPEAPELPSRGELESFDDLKTSSLSATPVIGTTNNTGSTFQTAVFKVSEGNNALLIKNGKSSAYWYTLGQGESTGSKYCFEAKFKFYADGKFDGVTVYSYNGDPDVTKGTNYAMMLEIAEDGTVTLSSQNTDTGVKNTVTAETKLVLDNVTWNSIRVEGGTEIGESITLYIDGEAIATVELASSLKESPQFKMYVNKAENVPKSGSLFFIDDCGVNLYD